MSDQVIAALIAVVAACIYVLGLALQQQGNRRTVAAGRRGMVAVVREPVWWLGVGLTCGGFLVHGFSLSIGSLTVVQPVQVSQIVFAVVLDSWITKQPIARRDWEGAALVVLGLATFMVIARPTAGTDFAMPGSWVWILGGLAVAALVMSVGAWRFAPARAVLLGALAGTIWGVQGALLKETSELVERGLADALTTWPLYATALLGVFGLVAQNAALRVGRLTVAAALITVMNPVVSSVIGLAAFGESLRSGSGALVGATVGAAVVILGVMLLSKRTTAVSTA